jgi:hypothetical protein
MVIRLLPSSNVDQPRRQLSREQRFNDQPGTHSLMHEHGFNRGTAEATGGFRQPSSEPTEFHHRAPAFLTEPTRIAQARRPLLAKVIPGKIFGTILKHFLFRGKTEIHIQSTLEH